MNSKFAEPKSLQFLQLAPGLSTMQCLAESKPNYNFNTLFNEMKLIYMSAICSGVGSNY